MGNTIQSANVDHPQTFIEVHDVHKVYGRDAHALKGVSVSIRGNEFFTLLGPSGCGKTSLLRLLAGFEQPTSGEILLMGKPVHDLPPYRRPINTVFQHYALFPNMTVAQNIGFGLRMLKRPVAEMQARVKEMLALVKMEKFADRRPSQLSGGQQQRVALARALAPAPRVLLLDEPLSALDLKLRQAMRLELKTLQEETGITFVFVTHDQEEALAMSDRIAVMSEGLVQQIGSPEEIYAAPVNRFVADFIGENNLLEGRVAANDREFTRVDIPRVGEFLARGGAGHSAGDRVTLAIRPEKISLGAWQPAAATGLTGTVVATVYLGTATSCHVRLGNDQHVVVRDATVRGGVAPVKVGDKVVLRLAGDAFTLLKD